jgi:hypothetical protein
MDESEEYVPEYDTIRCCECEALPGRCDCGVGYVPCR